jgi:hypothetical protein
MSWKVQFGMNFPVLVSKETVYLQIVEYSNPEMLVRDNNLALTNRAMLLEYSTHENFDPRKSGGKDSQCSLY